MCSSDLVKVGPRHVPGKVESVKGFELWKPGNRWRARRRFQLEQTPQPVAAVSGSRVDYAITNYSPAGVDRSLRRSRMTYSELQKLPSKVCSIEAASSSLVCFTRKS